MMLGVHGLIINRIVIEKSLKNKTSFDGDSKIQKKKSLDTLKTMLT